MDTRTGAGYAAIRTTEDTTGDTTVAEAEWLDSNHPPGVLLVHLEIDGFAKGEQGKRKRRLFACACCRRAWHLLPEGVCHEAVQIAESVADRRSQASELKGVGERIRLGEILPEHPRAPGVVAAVEAVRSLARGAVGEVATGMSDALALTQTRRRGSAYLAAKKCELAEQVHLLRDIFGNPYSPASIAPPVLLWNDSVVVRLAHAAYEERNMPEGTLDNGLLAILADALEEAGCTDADILGHLRVAGPHVRGCWPVDLCLGKS